MSTRSGATARSTARALARHGINARSAPMPASPLGADEWAELLSLVRAHRIAGQLAEAVATGALPTDDIQREQAQDLHLSAMEMCLLLEDDLLRTASLLDGAGIEYRVLKGPAHAHLDYPDPSLRVFGDIDLLVQGEDFDAAVAALVAEGHRRRHREVRPGFDRRFGKGVCLDGPRDRETDLHRTFVMGPFGLSIDLEEVWGSASELTLGGRSFAALDAEHRFLHACYHAALGRRTPGLVPLRDMAVMLHRVHDPLDLDRVHATARRWRGEAVLARAVNVAWDELELPESSLSHWAAGFSESGTDRRALRTYLDPGMGYAARQFAGLRALRSPRDKAAFAWALLVPDRRYGAGRHGGRARRLLEAGRQITELLRPRAGR